MSVYKVTFKSAPFGNKVPDKYITADDVDCYSEIATFYIRIPQEDTFGGVGNVGGSYRHHTVAACKEWSTVEEVDAIPFTLSQTGDSSEDI